MNEELRELIRELISKGNLNKNLVLMTYELDNDNHRETIERLSVVYEVKTLNEGFD